MESDNITIRARLLRPLRRAIWVIGIPLLLITLAGYLTSYAAGLPENEGSASPTGGTPLAFNAPAAPATATPGVTLVPNMAIRAFQTSTPTLTPTDVPNTATPTPESTATPAPTVTPEPTGTPAPTHTPVPTPTPPIPTSIPSTLAPFQAYAWVDNYYPVPGSVVTVHGRLFKNGRPVNGAQMGVTFSFTHGEAYCAAYSGIDGRAACSQNIGYPLQNYWVYIDVVFVHKDQLYYAKTGFLTDP